MARFIRIQIIIILTLFISGCMPSEITGTTPSGDKIKLLYYPGGGNIDDLIIIEGTNYFGTAQYQMNDQLADIGFRLKTGERVQAECTQVGKNIIGEDECKQYTVYRSNFILIPEGSVFLRPSVF